MLSYVRCLKLRSVSLVLVASRSAHTAQPAPIKVKWFYSTDNPISKPSWSNYTQEKEAQVFVAFSDSDSQRLEASYQNSPGQLVTVNEDKLYQVDLKSFELAPVYWEGPVYEVRRGTWFNSSGVPLPNKLSQAIEIGYHTKKPYSFKEEADKESKSSEKSRLKQSKDIVAKFNKLRDEKGQIELNLDQERDLVDLENGNLILYFDEKNAVMFPKSMDSSFQLGVIRNFGPSKVSLVSVEHIQRGYSSSSFKEAMPTSISDTWNEVSDYVLSQELPLPGPDRKVDHLVLCIHGIGQILGHKYESINFTHSINVLRNTMSTVFRNNKEIQKLVDDDTHSNRIQVLPISWRHKIDFHPQRTFKDNDSLPTLAQLTVDGIKPLRNLVGDVVLDILLYYEPKYINQVFEVVTDELNRVYRLYKEQNPDFNGKVHIMGHSLGSAISFDILANQTGTKDGQEKVKNLLDFDVENLFCVGSPVGVFKLLEQTGIQAYGKEIVSHDNSPEMDGEKDGTGQISAPKCKNIYNIFHPCDPIGYRIEPLIAPKFSKFKPETIPFALKGFNTQFEELANIGDEISEKLAKASSWFRDQKQKSPVGSDEERINRENALGDILSSITSTTKAEPSKDTKKKKWELEGEDLEQLKSLNSSGRIDYCLPQGMFEFSLLSAISAHVTYFEDVNTAGFIMKEILTKNRDVQSKTVVGS
ncbi:DDHD-domain-containing protein [Suhomyces tanzawaensis NRRL Y-17324]|uniref:DDHD-domain-containing protein n=1 Tax=Suhomyces tanzawaensis NRRL Y-17324 TaxID=984487 RepID=A0A1E4SHD6_9ASCO|nr:DDHD-domain-containing protein [Suhomyces tanzawaensis NRRL Y-17324]ODV78929.1 DDHD-domain-containing protein [Suhomyces tanzawaensis NRRL Y-17324]